MTVLIASFIGGVLVQLVRVRLARRISTNTRKSKPFAIRSRIHQLVVAYLLIHIGMVGGAEIVNAGIARFAIPGTLATMLGIGMFLVAWIVVGGLRIADRETRISLATHFGSVSVGTYATVQAFLTSSNIPYDPSSAAWLTLMEVPAILVGATLLGDGIESLKQALRDRDILLLLGSLTAGFILGPHTISTLDWIIVSPFEALLAYFLFDMGQHAGEQLPQLRTSGSKLIVCGLLMPLLGAALGGLAGKIAGMTLGDTIVLSTLSASASYVAATAVLGKMVSSEAIATSLTVSVGVTLPWNILFGIPLYTELARALQGLNPHFTFPIASLMVFTNWDSAYPLLGALPILGFCLPQIPAFQLVSLDKLTSSTRIRKMYSDIRHSIRVSLQTNYSFPGHIMGSVVPFRAIEDGWIRDVLLPRKRNDLGVVQAQDSKPLTPLHDGNNCRF